MAEPRVAIAHDYLTQRGGAERVVLALMKAFPEAPVYTTLFNPETTFPEFAGARIVTSWLNRIPALRRDHRRALPLLPFAANSLRIDADVVVASSTGWAHGFPTTGRTLVYCHSPARYLYLTEQYLGAPASRTLRGLALLALKTPITAWDQQAARRASRYLANSTVVQDRIKDVYRIEADVVPPPAGVDAHGPQQPVKALADGRPFYLVVSRLLPYKNVGQVVEAFRNVERRLVVVGRGPLRGELRASSPQNVVLLEDLSDAQLRWVYAHASALVAPSFEDFGLTPLEAGAHGKPTLALRAGGYLDTIREGVNGLFFEAPDAASIAAAVVRHEAARWDAQAIRSWVARFDETRFIVRVKAEVDDLASAGT